MVVVVPAREAFEPERLEAGSHCALALCGGPAC
jgi:hypothetical protein